MIVPLSKMMQQRSNLRYVKLYFRSPSRKVMRRERLPNSEVVPFVGMGALKETGYWDIWLHRRNKSIWP